MLTKKIQRHPTYVVSAPPTSGPIATAIPTVAPQIPKAVPRSRPWNSCEMIASETANIPAPPIPCAPRAMISQSGDVRRAAERRGDREERDRDEKDALAAEQVAERAGVEHRRREGERVGVHDPLQVGEGGVELLFDVRQRDVDYRDVEEQHEHCHAHHDEDAPFPLHSGETNEAGVGYGATKGQQGWRSRGY